MLYLPITLQLDFDENDLDYNINILFFKFKLKNRNGLEKIKRKLKLTSEKVDIPERVSAYFALFQAIADTLPILKRTIRIKKLQVDARYGNEDVALTGIFTGLAYAEIYKWIGFLSVIFTFEPPLINIKPVFDEKELLEYKGLCIIKSNLAHIIFTEYKFYYNFEKAFI